MLFTMIRMNRAENMIFVPLFLIITFISLKSAIVIICIVLFVREGVSHSLAGRIIMMSIRLVLFM